MTGDDTGRTGTARRTFLGAVGTATIGGTLPRFVDGLADPGVVLRQGDRCVPVTPLQGSEPVGTFYDYREADTSFSAAGATHLQRADGSVLFCYDGPEGLSLVAIHGKLDDSADAGDGGSASFAVDGLPATGSWVVRDDDYDGPSNYDRWDVGGGTHRIDWTWAGGRTDGGAFRGLGAEFSATVTPGFNEAAALFGRYYDGRVRTWEFLTGDPASPERISLRMDRPVTIETGSCGGDGTTTATTTTTRRPTTTRQTTTERHRTTERDDRDDDERDDGKGDDEERDDDEDEREEAHERREERFEEKADRAEEKAERKAERFEEKAERGNGKQAEKFEEKAERAREKGERKAEKFEEKAERAEEKADRRGDDDDEDDDDEYDDDRDDDE